MIQFWWRSRSRFGSGSPKSEIRILRIGGGLCCLSISSFVNEIGQKKASPPRGDAPGCELLQELAVAAGVHCGCSRCAASPLPVDRQLCLMTSTTRARCHDDHAAHVTTYNQSAYATVNAARDEFYDVTTIVTSGCRRETQRQRADTKADDVCRKYIRIT